MPAGIVSNDIIFSVSLRSGQEYVGNKDQQSALSNQHSARKRYRLKVWRLVVVVKKNRLLGNVQQRATLSKLLRHAREHF